MKMDIKTLAIMLAVVAAGTIVGAVVKSKYGDQLGLDSYEED